MNRVIRLIEDIGQLCYEKAVYDRSYRKYVFMFHMVSDHREKWYDAEYSISKEGFEKLIEQILENGFVISTAEEFMRCDTEKRILLTFDDAYESIYYEVFPLLKEQQQPFVVFQTWKMLGKKGYLSEDMIREMLGYRGFELGGHALTHSRLSDMNGKDSWFELYGSRKKLEELFQTDIKGMAYPYGSKSAVRVRDMRYAEKVGYQYAFGTVNSGTKLKRCGLYYIPRVNVNENNYRDVLERCKEN